MLTFNDQIDAIRRKIADIAIARVNGQSYALPVWSVDYPSIPADLVDTLLASFNVPSMATLEAELVASQAAAPNDVLFPDVSSLVALPGDADSYAQPVVTQPIVMQPAITQPVTVTQPAAPAAGGGGAALLLALASYYFFGA